VLSTWYASFGLAADLASSSDIQKKLRALFPLDYAKDHRKYRPSNDVNMKARLDHLRRCKRGRISKEKRLRHYSRGTFRTPAFKDLRQDSMGSCRNFAHAFRDYSTLSSYDIPTILSPNLVDSEPVISSLLLLDGSSSSPASTESGSDMTRTTCIDNLSGKSPLDLRTSAALDTTSSPTITHSKQLEISATRARSIRSLGRQLADKYSESYLKHIHSTMRYSSSNSWRSSLTSFSSRASSLLSRRSAHDKSNAEEVSYSKHWERTGPSHPYNQKSIMSTLDEIDPMELEVWNELIDEGKVCPGPRPRYLTVSPLNRKCCNSLAHIVCPRCGFTSDHRYATCGQVYPSSENSFVTRSDFYGNTPLHCAAALTSQHDFWLIRKMISQGVDVFPCNTFGETFFHVLCRNGPRTAEAIADFVLIARDLQVVDFPFSIRDYYGRTIMHVLFQNSMGYPYAIPFLQEVFRIMKPNLSLKDNSGFCVEQYHEQFDQNTAYYANFRALVNEWCAYFGTPLSFANFRPNLFPDYHQEYFRRCLESNIRPEHITVIDDVGDSPLLSLLKHWNEDTWKNFSLTQTAKEMIQSGAIIHTRDRNGDTALAIAARRGFRRVVTLLLAAGAVVHIRNYRGVGILRQVEQSLAHDQAKSDPGLWSRLWSCQIALIDAGAIVDPTERDEWMSPSSRLLVEKEFAYRASASKPLPTPYPNRSDGL
jgi:ankyrin repeat protein